MKFLGVLFILACLIVITVGSYYMDNRSPEYGPFGRRLTGWGLLFYFGILFLAISIAGILGVLS